MNLLKNTEFEPLIPNDPEKQPDTAVDLTGYSSTLSLDSDYRATTATFDKISFEPVVSRETILKSGTYAQLYKLFRRERHHALSASLRALCQRCEIRYQESATELKKEYSAVQAHPHGWSSDKKDTHKSNVWSVLRIALDAFLLLCRAVLLILLAPFRLVAAIAHTIDNALHGTRALTSLLGTVLLYGLAAGLITYTVYAVRMEKEKAYELKVYLDGAYVGTADSVTDVLSAKHTYEKTLSDAYGMPVVLPCEISYDPIDEAAYDSATKINANSISVFQAYMDSYLAEGYGLYIDNKLVAVTESSHDITEALEDYRLMLQQHYMRAYQQDVPESFVLNNDTTLIYQKYPKNYFLTVDELRSMFYLDSQQNAAADEEAGVPKTLKYANAGKTGAGDGADFLSSVPSSGMELGMSMITEETVTETIPFTEEYVYDDTMYEGMRRMLRPGVNGKRVVRYRITYSDDKIVGRELLSEEITEAPVSAVIRTGTKEVPENLRGSLPTGTFIYPYNGTITSPFGWRNIFGSTSFHTGIDIFGPYQSTIVAADGGEVIEVSYEGSYGNYVLIRHDESTVTRYAHCDYVTVKKGDLVGQGYPIAAMGRTGRVTGVHVHFEVIKNGSVVDPIPYMSGTLPSSH